MPFGAAAGGASTGHDQRQERPPRRGTQRERRPGVWEVQIPLAHDPVTGHPPPVGHRAWHQRRRHPGPDPEALDRDRLPVHGQGPPGRRGRGSAGDGVEPSRGPRWAGRGTNGSWRSTRCGSCGARPGCRLVDRYPTARSARCGDCSHHLLGGSAVAAGGVVGAGVHRLTADTREQRSGKEIAETEGPLHFDGRSLPSRSERVKLHLAPDGRSMPA